MTAKQFCGLGQWPSQVEVAGKYCCDGPESFCGSGGAAGFICGDVLLTGRYKSFGNTMRTLMFGLGKASKVAERNGLML